MKNNTISTETEKAVKAYRRLGKTISGTKRPSNKQNPVYYFTASEKQLLNDPRIAVIRDFLNSIRQGASHSAASGAKEFVIESLYAGVQKYAKYEDNVDKDQTHQLS